MKDADIIKMVADYMERGFLENIIDMFLHDSGLYDFVGELIRDERVRVRLGVTAMIEELAVRDRQNISRAAAPLFLLLSAPEPVVRGDAANLLGIIGDERALPHLERLLSDPEPSVRLLAKEAAEEIRASRNL